MGKKIDSVAGDKPGVRFLLGAGGGAIALAGSIASIVAINSPVVSVLASTFSSAAGFFLMSNAVDRSVDLVSTFKNKAALKAGVSLAGAFVVGAVALGINTMKSQEQPLQSIVLPAPTPQK